MTSSPATLDPEATQAVLSAALRALHGDEASLEAWTAQLFTKRGKRRAVRYDLQARVAGKPQVQHYEWVGKFYPRHDEAQLVVTILRQLAATDCSARGGLVIPSVLGYDAPRHLLFLTYEPGESVIAAIARCHGLALSAIGRALAALHTTATTLATITSRAAVLGDLQRRIAELRTRFPLNAAAAQHLLSELERQAPVEPATPSLLHGDLGPAHLLWRTGTIVMLDFDRCTRGDPALDLGSLLTQLRRLSLRKPAKLPDFAAVRRGILEAYQRVTPPDPGLAQRVAWYEQVTLLRKIHFLACDTTRHDQAEALRQRRAEAIRLWGELRES